MPKDLIKKLLKPIPVDPDMEDFSNDPYVIAKTEKAKKFLMKTGIPETSMDKQKKSKGKPPFKQPRK